MRILEKSEAQASILLRTPFAEIEPPVELLSHLQEIFGRPVSAEEATREILQDVRQRGDQALRDWGARLDHCRPADLALEADQLTRAYERLSPALAGALQMAAQRIRRFHEKQPQASWLDSSPEGFLGQLVQPVDRVGIYCPGGSAPLPSTLLMTVIPAQVARVPSITLITPPQAETGMPHEIILAAAHVVGLETVYVSGGAQAIGALAYGTESVPPVDKICGPGGLFTTLAKKQLFGQVGIDGLPGPTETMILADAAADPDTVAIDLLGQAEHDVLASAILLTPSRRLAEQVQQRVVQYLPSLPRRAIIRGSLERGSGIVVTASLEEAVGLANQYAPEHLCLMVSDPWTWVGRIRNAGGVFLGHDSFEVLGDYVAGPSHVMPTNGTARFSSALNVLDFVRIVSLFGLNHAVVDHIGPAAVRLAQAEGLDAHAQAVTTRLDPSPPPAPA